MRMLQNRRTAVGLILLMIVLIGGTVGYVIFFGHGNQNTKSALATPTVTVPSRVFEVSAEESKVDFTTQVNGIEVEGFFPVSDGRITLEPVGNQLRVLVDLEINVDGVSTGNAMIDFAMRTAMKTRGNGETYPMSFYAATSVELVPVTEEEIHFDLAGNLQLHGSVNDHPMTVDAQLVGSHMWAIATSDLDMSNYGIQLPPPIESSTIKLTARLQAYEVESVGTVTEPPQ